MIRNNPNLRKILEIIKEGDRVLDIGGWGGTLNRATHVIDINPYDTRQKKHQLGGEEKYSKETWFQLDVCDRTPLPFPDKYFDFVFCSHVLEDIRDPIWLCFEIKRIAKKGYLEFPSPKYELSRGVEGIEGRGYVGNAHHRWVIFVNNNKVKFLQKHHFVNGQARFSIPYSYYKKMNIEEKISYLFFDNNFSFEEMNIWDENELKSFFEGLIKSFNCRNKLFWIIVELNKKIIRLGVKIKNISYLK